ncbi:hypothetical protein [Luteimonas sp. MC1825]|uniref:hypothetical protein n=1 Tax=Luteimonas sp. MC1825 TaxID=2761107 RepID=UPI001607C833|nr:hypothetical protein [Luteimonas sp. MC1825]MBB6600326.1 hypothetical protein [Luteimonas sp. MC1825]QOC88004.1 hypothetical protein IDM46_12415 [Luteimonas sp. MC1825]
MTDTILCITDEEAPCFQKRSQRGFAIRLSFETDRVDEVDAQQAFNAFLLRLEAIRFAVYQLQNGIFHNVAAQTQGEAFCRDSADALIGWLPSQKPTAARSFFYTPSQQYEQTKTADLLDARDVIMGVAGFVAPLPQKLHLACVIHVDRVLLLPDPDAPVVVLPHFDQEAPASLPVAPVVPGEYFLISEAGVLCRSIVSRPAEAPSTDISLDEGFAPADGSSQEAHTAMARVEQRAGSLVTGFLAANEVAMPVTDDIGSGLNAPSEAEQRAQVRRRAWRAITALAAAFDTLLIALRMPGAPRRDGALLAGLLTHLNVTVGEAWGKPLSNRQLRDALREAIAALPALSTLPTDAAKRSTLVSVLRHLAGLPGQPASLDDSTDWLMWLLHGYIHADNGDVWKDVAGRAGIIGSDDATDRPLTWQDRWDRQDRELDRQIAAFYSGVTSESGLEAAALRIFRWPDVAHTFCTQIGGPQPPVELVQAYEAALSAWEREFAAVADGASAARQAVGTLVCDRLTTAVRFRDKPTELLRQNFRDLNFWARRFNSAALPAPGTALPFPELFASLIHPVPEPASFFGAIAGASPLPDDWLDANEWLGMQPAIAEACARMTESCTDELFPPADRRFRPDEMPVPIALQVTLDAAADDDDTQVDEFAAAFSGVGVLLRRQDGAAVGSGWSYATMAELLADPAPAWMAQARGIQALPTTVCNGRRSLFVSYKGLPFATAAYSEALPEEGGDPAPTFCTTDYPEDVAAIGAPLPPLAYGSLIEVAAYVVGRASSLPLRLQDGKPWVPCRVPTLPAVAGWSETNPYSRTTAIGGTAIADVSTTPRIGTAPEEVSPFLAQSPRLAVSGIAITDVFRSSDGGGAIAFPPLGSPATVLSLTDIRQFRAADSAQTLQIAPLQQATATHEFPAAHDTYVTFAGASVARLRITLNRTAQDAATLEFHDGHASLGTLNVVPSQPSMWLRLRCVGSGLGESVSLGDPSAETRSSAATGRSVPENLLLLASHQPTVWNAPFNEATSVKIQTPRTRYEDWDHWTNHPELRKRVFGASPVDQKKGDTFCRLLRAASIERLKDRQLNALLDQLPDPAVAGLRIDVVPLDGLREEPASLQRTLRAVTVDVGLPSLGELFNRHPGIWDKIKKNQAKACLVALAQVLDWDLSMDTSKDGAISLDASAKNLTLPEGIGVRVATYPIVLPDFFAQRAGGAPFISPKLLQFAVGQLPQAHSFSNGYCFAGATLQIETMLGSLQAGAAANRPLWQLTRDDWAELAFRTIRHDAVASARQYVLVAAPAAPAWQWRQLGSIGVLTQRWRFTGRPIENWFRPALAAKQSQSGDHRITTSVEVQGSEVYDFEAHAFGDRDETDADLASVRLVPDFMPTLLASQTWDHPSATMFRHRFELRSRYIGALRRPTDGRCEAWSPNATDPKAWLRVVMLGERSRITLTRPQLRALMPLTASTDSIQDKTPPLLALLQESPYAFGGLADRLVAEIQSGVGYALQTNGAVGPNDVRREVGPDPRLSYRATPEDDAARLCLEVDGPLGLSYEPELRAAAFPHAALMLHPRRLAAVNRLESANIQEHLLSVGMRRYLDPDWLVPEPPLGDRSPFRQTWVAEFSAADGVALTITPTGSNDGRVVLVKDVPSSADVVVRIRHWAVDATSQVDTDLVLAVVPRGATLSLIHAPLDERRAAVGILIKRAKKADILLASLEWSLPTDVPTATLALVNGNQIIARRATSASGATPTYWARTQRNFDTLTHYDDSNLTRVADVPVGTLEAVLTEYSVSFARKGVAGIPWMRAKQGGQPFPVHTQRHLAVVLMRTQTRFGRQLTVPTGTYMACSRHVRVSAADLAGVTGVQVLELEMPARILGFIPGAQDASYVPTDFQQAYFDLVSVGAVPATMPPSLFFFARFIGAQASLRTLSELTMRIRRNEESAGQTIRVSRDINGIELAAMTISANWNGAAYVFEASFITAKGDIQKAITTPSEDTWVPTAEGTQGLWLALETPPASELWLEVSMLASQYSAASAEHGYLGKIDFDWFFGRGVEQALIATREASMRATVEAQARLVAASPEIPVQPAG